MAPERAYLIVAQPATRRRFTRPGGLVRRHRPGRHRTGALGGRQHRPAHGRGVPARPRRDGDRIRPGRHAARRAPRPADLARSASALVVLSTLLVSGWFAASGAAAFAGTFGP
jgi:hypothetical protein